MRIGSIEVFDVHALGVVDLLLLANLLLLLLRFLFFVVCLLYFVLVLFDVQFEYICLHLICYFQLRVFLLDHFDEWLLALLHLIDVNSTVPRDDLFLLYLIPIVR